MSTHHRIETITSFYQSEPHVWDLFCDHGLIGLNVLNKENIQTLHFVDCVPEIIDRLKSKIATHPKRSLCKLTCLPAEKIEFNNSPGQLFIFAGVGGDLMIKVLEHWFEKYQKIQGRFIFSPHRNPEGLRRFLIEHEYMLEQETVIEDNAQFYQIFCCSLQAEHTLHPWGSMLWNHANPTTKKYADHLIRLEQKKPQNLQNMALLSHLKQLNY